MTDLNQFLARAERLLERLEPLLPPASPAPDWNAAAAFRWRKRGGVGFLQAIAQPATIRLADLQDIDEQKARIVANTRQFLAGKRANNVLLTGARGTGKSSLVKALLTEFAAGRTGDLFGGRQRGSAPDARAIREEQGKTDTQREGDHHGHDEADELAPGFGLRRFPWHGRRRR